MASDPTKPADTAQDSTELDDTTLENVAGGQSDTTTNPWNEDWSGDWIGKP